MSVRKYNVSSRSFILRNRLILRVCKYRLSNYANEDVFRAVCSRLCKILSLTVSPGVYADLWGVTSSCLTL